MERAKGVAGNPNMRRKDQYGQIYVAIVGHNAKGEMGQVWFYVDIIGNCHPDSIITKDEQMGPTRVVHVVRFLFFSFFFKLCMTVYI